MVGVAERLAEVDAPGELPNPLLPAVGGATVGMGAEVTIGCGGLVKLCWVMVGTVGLPTPRIK